MRRREGHDRALWSDAAPRLLRLARAEARVRQEGGVCLSNARVREANLTMRLHGRWRIGLRELDGVLELDGMERGVAVDRDAAHGVVGRNGPGHGLGTRGAL